MAAIVFLVILSAYFPIAPVLITAFILGLLKNMWFGETLGVASVLYICIVYAIHLYKRKFNAHATGFIFCASIITIFITSAIESGSMVFSKIEWIHALITTSIIVVLFKVLNKLWGPQDERKLPV